MFKILWGLEKFIVDCMKYFYFLLLAILPVFVKAQATRYDVAADMPVINTYIPMSPEEIYLRARASVLYERQMEERFEQYSQIAYDELRRNHIDSFVYYALAALDCGYYNSNLYYNIGVAYSIMGQRRKAKKYLKKAVKEGHSSAPHALKAVKEKNQLSRLWFAY